MKSISTGRVISKDGTRIAFNTMGEGDAVIFVAPALADRSVFLPLAQLMARHFTVFSYDRRGRGDSGDASAYAVDREIEDLETIINEAGGTASVFGGSSGAVLALEAAIHGLTILKLALYEPPFVLDDSRPAVPGDSLDQLRKMLASGRRGDMVEYFMTKMVGVPPEAVAAMRAAPMWPALESLAHTLIYDVTLMGDFSLPTGTGSIKLPTLAIRGGASPEWLHQAVRAVARAIPGAQLRMLEGQTHAVDPAVLAPVLLEFFANS